MINNLSEAGALYDTEPIVSAPPMKYAAPDLIPSNNRLYPNMHLIMHLLIYNLLI